jgi:hypothetical protein
MNDNSYQIPIAPGNPFGLGRHVHHDPQNFLTQHLALIQPPVRQKSPYRAFPRGLPYDQGDSPSCTIHATIGLCRTSPNATGFSGRSKYDSETEMRAAYEESKAYDPWPGSDYDGTSSDAPYKLLRERGEIKSWKWLKGETEVREWVSWYGPCTCGTVWLNDMFYPDENGFLTVSGSVAGGHEYELVQYSPTRDAYRVVNSWGTSWGQNGRAWLRSADLAELLNQDGDAVTVGV